jgi:hypothetical protein
MRSQIFTLFRANGAVVARCCCCSPPPHQAPGHFPISQPPRALVVGQHAQPIALGDHPVPVPVPRPRGGQLVQVQLRVGVQRAERGPHQDLPVDEVAVAQAVRKRPLLDIKYLIISCTNWSIN